MKIITTADGSSSIYVEELDEQYHSVHGAFNEAMHVFVEHGLRHKAKAGETMSILEMGFGTGLNAMLTQIHNPDVAISYTSIEKFPVADDLIKSLNYEDYDEKESGVFEQLHSAEWGIENLISDQFNFTKIKVGLEEYSPDKKFDVIYYDAFAPRVQPELWTEEIFKKCYELTSDNGCLVTYCAKGQVKRNLKAAGYDVETLPGPPGKREMTRANKV